MLRTRALLLLPLAAAASAAGASAAIAGPPYQHFHSRPDLRPPPFTVLTRARHVARGYVFLAPKRKVAQAGPMIVDDAGRLVWFHPLDTKGVSDFRVQRYRGRPVLTWWRGHSAAGHGLGRYEIVDSSYRELTTVRAGHGYEGDIHEFLITPRRTALLTIYHRVPRDLTAIGGPKKGWVTDGIFQEISLATRRVLFEWHSLRHVPLSESEIGIPDGGKGTGSVPYDYFHINSVDVEADGNFLISARHTSAIYEIDRRSGKVLWRLGGRKSDFAFGPGARFAWQHDARRRRDGTITLLDNAVNRPWKKGESRALVLRLDPATHRATLVRAFAHTPPLKSTSQANAQFLPDGHVFVGWGSSPYVTEFGPRGRVLFDARFGRGADSYRAYRFDWTGRPGGRPAIAVDGAGSGRVEVYASWNGATEIARWQVLAGADRRHLREVAAAPKRGFETAIATAAASARYFAVRALDRTGRVLGTSAAIGPGAQAD